MNKCTKCGHMTIETTLYPCKCKVCLICGFVEFYTTLDDLTKFNQNADIYNENDLLKIRELLKELNKKRLILSKNTDSNSNIQEMILHGQVCILQDILQDWTLI